MNTSAHAQDNHLIWLSWRGYLWLSWIGLLMLALAGGLALLGGNLGGGFVLLTLALGVLIYGPRLRSLLAWPMLFVVLIACLGIALGALWEVVEWFVDLLPSIRIINPLADTISDLIVDSLGALLAGLLSCWIVNSQQRKE